MRERPDPPSKSYIYCLSYVLIESEDEAGGGNEVTMNISCLALKYNLEYRTRAWNLRLQFFFG
jgi:hypothetical protein